MNTVIIKITDKQREEIQKILNNDYLKEDIKHQKEYKIIDDTELGESVVISMKELNYLQDKWRKERDECIYETGCLNRYTEYCSGRIGAVNDILFNAEVETRIKKRAERFREWKKQSKGLVPFVTE